jgi:hypothetical protein
VVVKLHIDVLVVFWAVIIFALLLVAKGARIKWLQDSGIVLREREPGHPVHVGHGGTYIENYHAALGEPSPVAQQRPGITISEPQAQQPQEPQPQAQEEPQPTREAGTLPSPAPDPSRPEG